MNKSSLHIIHNGVLLPASEPVLLADNRAFCYGDALFETMHAKGADIQYVNEHFARLHQGMAALKIDGSEELSLEKITKEIYRLINRDRLFGGVRIKLEVYRNSEGLYKPLSNRAGYLLHCTPLEAGSYEFNKKGLQLGLFTEIKKQVNCFSAFKTSNSLINVMAGIYCKDQGLDDCLIINEQNVIIEGFHSNLFLVKGNTLYTPPLSQGCVDGVMRKQIIKLAPLLGLKTSENISIAESLILDADEVFLTNAIQGISWALAFKNRRYFNKISRAISEKLNFYTFESTT